MNTETNSMTTHDRATCRAAHSPARRVLQALAAAALGVALLGAWAGRASAEVIHPFIASFNASATPSGSFFPFGLAVDNSSSTSAGDIYVTDYSHSVIDKFSPSGTYLCQITGQPSATTSSPSECAVTNGVTSAGVPGGFFGITQGKGAVDPSGDLYVGDSGAVDEFSPAGAFLTQLQGPTGGIVKSVVINGAGDLYVSAGDEISEYDPGTSSWSTFATGTPTGAGGSLVPFGNASRISVDDDPSSPAYGNVYVTDAPYNAIDVFNASGAFQAQLTGTSDGAFPGVGGVDVDPTSGDIYVSTGHDVDELSPADALVSQTVVPNSGGPEAVAFNAVTDDMYVADISNSVIDEFGPAIVVPNVTTSAVSGLGTTSATLSGSVDPAGGGTVTGCEFEYGTSTNYGQTAQCSPATPYTGVTSVSAALTGLAPSTTYHYRLDATNTSGTNVSSDGTFTTTGPPTIDSETSTGVTRSCVTLQAQVNPNGLDTTVQFDYGTSMSYGQTTSSQDIGSGVSDQAVSAQVCGLVLGTTYHFDAVATNSAAPSGGVVGSDRIVTTEGAAGIDSQTAVAGTHSAVLTGQINPDGLDTTCQVQYVDASDYQSSGYANATTLPCNPSDLGSGSTDQTTTVALSGLAISSTYDYRFVVTNSAGTVDGVDESFSTWGVSSFSFATTDQSGNPYTQAGGHPWQLTTTFVMNTTPTSTARLVQPDGTLKDVEVHLPVGLVGNPTAVPQCSDYDLSRFQCQPDTEIGEMTVYQNSAEPFNAPLFNVVPPAGVPAEFGARFNNFANAYITAGVRTGSDYGIDADSINITGLTEITGASVTIWGVPADPSHDDQRECPSTTPGGSYQAPPCSSTAPLKPFLSMPTSCTGPQTVGLQADSYQDPGDYAFGSTQMPANTGCNQLDFSPSLSVQPDTSSADSPSGLAVDLSVPQNQGPSGLAEANLKNVSVSLPTGVSVDPSAAAGLTSCTPTEIGMSNGNAPSCPANSKVGTVEIDSPLLADPLTGGVYIAQQNQNPFNSLLAIYLTAYADGVWVKLAGHVVPNPVTGQLTTTLDNNPQLPFTDFKLDFFDGVHGILATPQQCGTYTTTSDLSSYAGGPDATPSDSFTIDSGCVNGFAPTFTAGTMNPQAGKYSPFVLSLTRADTDQSLSGLSVTLPDGMLAKLNGVAECSDADLAAAAAATGAQEQANPSCPASSQVGTVEAGAGVGPDPYFLSGNVYLTGPYKGAPYGLAVVVPAVAGPYDLGTVVVRQALDINPTTAQVTDVSDPFPTILQGIPLRIRRIDVDLNRPGFTVNPTSCTPSSVNGTVTSTAGATAKISSRFQVGGCAALSFSPKLKLGLSGKGQTKSGDHPTLTATLTQGRGQANLSRAKVALPLSMALDPNNSQHVCPFAVAAAVHGGAVGCPASTIVGTATANTPLLSKPLTGKVYLVQGFRTNNKGQRIHTLPTLLVPLRGQIAIDLHAQTSVNKAAQLVTTFSTIPDAQISKFTLKITGGKKGLLVITGRGRTICGKPQVASENLGAQSGKSMVADDTLTTPCKHRS